MLSACISCRLMQDNVLIIPLPTLVGFSCSKDEIMEVMEAALAGKVKLSFV